MICSELLRILFKKFKKVSGPISDSFSLMIKFAYIKAINY